MRITLGPLLKVVAFVLVMGTLITAVGFVFGRVKIQPSHEYHAIFADASGIKSGADVRGNGVSVGSIKSVDMYGNNAVKVTFTVAKGVELSTTSVARIRYANLTGDRYLDLTPGVKGGTPLEPGATIPMVNTQPALDLDAFFRGFDPLMRGLDPQEINQLSASILAVTQGQAGSVRTALATVARFTSHLADHSDLIGQTITNLSKSLATINSRKSEVGQLVTGVTSLLHGYAQDRRVIASSLSKVDAAAYQTGDLLRRVRPGLKAGVKQVGVLAGELNKDTGDISSVLDAYPLMSDRLGRIGAYGSFFNFYLCGVKVTMNFPGKTLDVYTPWVLRNDGRCAGKGM